MTAVSARSRPRSSTLAQGFRLAHQIRDRHAKPSGAQPHAIVEIAKTPNSSFRTSFPLPRGRSLSRTWSAVCCRLSSPLPERTSAGSHQGNTRPSPHLGERRGPRRQTVFDTTSRASCRSTAAHFNLLPELLKLLAGFRRILRETLEEDLAQ